MHSALRISAILLLSTAAAIRAQQPEPKRPVDALGDPLPPGALMRLGTVRWRPSGSNGQMAFSHDGRRMATWDGVFSVTAFTIWDVATGRELRRLEAPGMQVGPFVWLPDGRGLTLAFTSEGRYLWEFTDETFVLPHKVATGPNARFAAAAAGRVVDNQNCTAFALSPDGKCLAGCKEGDLANKERDVVLWDVKTQTKVADLPTPRRLGSVPNNCTSLYFTPDGRKIVAFCEPLETEAKKKEFLVAVLDAATGKELRRFTSPTPNQGATVALSARYLAVGLEVEDGAVPIWDLEKGADRRLLTGHGKRAKAASGGYGVTSLIFSADGAALMTAGRDGIARIWDTATWEKRRTIDDAHPSWIEQLAVTADGQRLACAGQEGVICHFDLATGNELDVEIRNRDRITGIQFSPGGSSVVTAGADGQMTVWDPASGKKARSIRIQDKNSGWPSLLLMPDGRTALVGVANKLKAWNVATGAEVQLPEALSDIKVGRVSLAGEGKTLLVHRTTAVSLLDWPAGKLRRTVTLPEPAQKPGESHCDAADLSPDGRWLVTSSHRYWYREERGMRFGYGDNSVLDLWNAASGERIHRLVDGGGGGRNARFTADGDLLVDITGKLHPLGGGGDIELKGQFNLIDPLTGQLKQSFDEAPLLAGTTHRYNSAMGIAPDGRTIVCTGNDGVIHLYETATGKIRRTLTRHRDYINGLSFTNDGRRLVTASHDLTALVWDTSLASVSMKNSPPLTPAQRAQLWEQLTANDAKTAYEAMATFAAQPQAAVASIRAGIKPAARGPADATLDRLVDELGDDKFAVRERAARELNELGESAAPGMRSRLAKSLPLETHRRVVQFLEKHDPATITPTHLRELRALEVLEQINNSDAVQLLTELANGGRDARLTRAAAAALARRRGGT